MAHPGAPKVGDTLIPALEAEVLAKKVDKKGHGPLGGKSRSLKPLKIKEVFHESAVPSGLARTWCVKVGGTCYDAAWSEQAKAWVYGGANSGMQG